MCCHKHMQSSQLLLLWEFGKGAGALATVDASRRHSPKLELLPVQPAAPFLHVGERPSCLVAFALSMALMSNQGGAVRASD